MKKQYYKRPLILAFALLIGVSLSCFVWVRKEQRQYALNRALIVALEANDADQALYLLNAGADLNTRLEPLPAPHFVLLEGGRYSIPRLYFIRPTERNNQSITALMIACGSWWQDEHYNAKTVQSPDPKLTQLLLMHGANVNAECCADTYSEGYTALMTATINGNKKIIKEVLDYGGNPDLVNREGFSPISCADSLHRPEIIDLLRKYSKHL